MQVYCGPYRTPNQLQEAVTEVDDPYKDIKTGSMIAIFIKGYKKHPAIGKVIQRIDGDKLKVQYWKGSMRKKWEPHMVYDKKKRCFIHWTDIFIPLRSVILSNFELKNKLLTSGQRKYLKEKYASLVNE